MPLPSSDEHHREAKVVPIDAGTEVRQLPSRNNGPVDAQLLAGCGIGCVVCARGYIWVFPGIGGIELDNALRLASNSTTETGRRRLVTPNPGLTEMAEAMPGACCDRTNENDKVSDRARRAGAGGYGLVLIVSTRAQSSVCRSGCRPHVGTAGWAARCPTPDRDTSGRAISQVNSRHPRKIAPSALLKKQREGNRALRRELRRSAACRKRRRARDDL